MRSKTAQATIAKLKMVFAWHGIPQTVIADNMPFDSRLQNICQVMAVPDHHI